MIVVYIMGYLLFVFDQSNGQIDGVW